MSLKSTLYVSIESDNVGNAVDVLSSSLVGIQLDSSITYDGYYWLDYMHVVLYL